MTINTNNLIIKSSLHYQFTFTSSFTFTICLSSKHTAPIMQFFGTILSALIVAGVTALPAVNEQQTKLDNARAEGALDLFDCLNRMEPHGGSKSFRSCSAFQANLHFRGLASL
jgi:hypothetical protein